jgi:hypothetical protein
MSDGALKTFLAHLLSCAASLGTVTSVRRSAALTNFLVGSKTGHRLSSAC